MSDKGKFIDGVAAAPDETIVFVDPAGLHHIQPPGGPSGAGGAAGAIYKFLGIHRSDRFPDEVINAVQQTGDAKYHMYEGGPQCLQIHCIHAVGPNFNGEDRGASWDDAVEKLSIAHFNVLREFAASSIPNLRMLPISGGIFAGEYQPQVAKLTAEALRVAAGRLSDAEKAILAERKLELCIFMEAEVEAFRAATGDGLL